MGNKDKYYLINGKIMKGGEMPEIDDFTNTNITYIGAHEDWTDSLQPCDISESEKAKIIHTILVNNTDVILSNPIDVTYIINDNDGVITFKPSENVTRQIVREAMRIASKDVQIPKCVRDGLVKPKSEETNEAVDIQNNMRLTIMDELYNTTEQKSTLNLGRKDFNEFAKTLTDKLYEIFKSK